MAKTAEDKIVYELHDITRQLKNIGDNKFVWAAVTKTQATEKNTMRPCYISKKSFKDGPRKAIFHKWVGMKSPNMTQTLALVEYEDGTVEQVKPTSIIFADSKRLFAEYCWPVPEEGDDNEGHTTSIAAEEKA